MKYAVVIEQGPASFGAYVPDLPGCIATAPTREAVVGLIREAIAFHIEGLRLKGDAVPLPCSGVEVIDTAA